VSEQPEDQVRVHPLRDWSAGAVAGRLFAGVAFGVLVDVAILVASLPEMPPLLLLAAVPVVWGVLSLFFLRPMLAAGRWIFNQLLDDNGRW
jgi:hypothetical protein